MLIETPHPQRGHGPHGHANADGAFLTDQHGILWSFGNQPNQITLQDFDLHARQEPTIRDFSLTGSSLLPTAAVSQQSPAHCCLWLLTSSSTLLAVQLPATQAELPGGFLNPNLLQQAEHHDLASRIPTGTGQPHRLVAVAPGPAQQEAASGVAGHLCIQTSTGAVLAVAMDSLSSGGPPQVHQLQAPPPAAAAPGSRPSSARPGSAGSRLWPFGQSRQPLNAVSLGAVQHQTGPLLWTVNTEHQLQLWDLTRQPGAQQASEAFQLASTGHADMKVSGFCPTGRLHSHIHGLQMQQVQVWSSHQQEDCCKAIRAHKAIDTPLPHHVQVAAVLPAAEGAWDVWLLSKQGVLQCWAAGAMLEDVRLLETQHDGMLQGNPGLQVRHC